MMTANLIFIALATLLILTALLLHYKDKLAILTNKTDKAQSASTPGVVIPRKKAQYKRITLEESWKFLAKISEIVMFRFSRADRATILKLGSALLSAGVSYQHVIEYGVRSIQVEALSIEKKDGRQTKQSGGR